MHSIKETTDYYPLSLLFRDSGLEVKPSDKAPETTKKLWRCDDAQGLAGACQFGIRAGHCCLECLAVREDVRKTGLGKKLLELAEQEAKALGSREIWLVGKVPEYYEQFGWVRVNRQEAPPISKCLTCGQFQVDCFPSIMKKVF
ncbi:MAG: GNAT family N-acetyltransferase [Ruminiclostridium sp.]|nr:GNAT family N-acetyltransferase [Ruminiclostridium sp.]